MGKTKMGDRYSGGYATSSGLPQEKLRVQTSTFKDYVSGTVGIVFLIFLVFLLLQIMTLVLMALARYLKDRSPKPGFYNPQPMVHRYGSNIKNGNRNGHHNSRSGTLTRSEYSGVSANPAQSFPTRQLGTAMSMQSQQSMTA